MARAMPTVTTTTATGFSAAGLAAVIIYVSQGCPQPMPDTVAMVLAAGALSVLHTLYAVGQALVKRWGVEVPAAPAGGS